jgi:glycosyltransferase involved in cell wall biosynthesis
MTPVLAARSQNGLAPIVFFGNDWQAENRTSSHQIARRLATRTHLVYFECPGLRAPSGSARDVRKLVSKIRRFARGSVYRDGVLVATLLQLPLHQYAAIRRLNRWLLWLTVRLVMIQRRMRRPISWFMVPHVASLAGTLDESRVVYYCIDDYAALPGVNADAVSRFDEELTRKADVVFVASDTLVESKRALNTNTFLSPHGVDYEHFSIADRPETEPPAEIAGLPRPVIGFFGLVEDWIDLDLVDFVARERPKWTVLMIGRVAVDRTPQRPNLKFIGHRPYAALPRFGRCFDAAIIPYKLTRQVVHSNPTKLREYLAMGKPVVAVSTPEIDKFSDVVEIARTPQEFLARLDAAVADRDPARAAARMRRAAEVSWDARVEQALGIVGQRRA